jgi:hypothetical protein
MHHHLSFFSLSLSLSLSLFACQTRPSQDQIKEFKEWVDGICPAILPTAPEGCMVEGLVEEKKDTPTGCVY